MNTKHIVRIILLTSLCLAAVGCGAENPAEVSSSGSGFTPAAVCIVPNVAGLGESVANDQLVGLGLQPVKTTQYDASVAEGSVISQDPPADTRKEPCQGDVTIVVSLGPVPGPTATPTPPPSPTPIPPTPTPLSTPVPGTTLFLDDFEGGIKPEWKMSGNGFSAANGKFILENGMVESGIVGDISWHNYEIRFNQISLFGDTFEIFVRAQDRDNYMFVKCRTYGKGNPCEWYRVVDGAEQAIAGAHFSYGSLESFSVENHLRLEMQGNIYRVIVEGEQALYFTDDTFAYGGFGLLCNDTQRLQIGSVEVVALP